MRALLPLALGVVLSACNMAADDTASSSVQANFAATEENLSRGADAAQACLSGMPDFDKIVSTLQTQGLAFREGTSGIDLYSTRDWDVIAQLQVGDIPNWICSVRVDEMTSEQAVTLAQPWVDAIKGKPLPEPRTDIVSVWRGETGNYDAVVVVYSPQTFPKINGATIKLEFRRKDQS